MYCTSDLNYKLGGKISDKAIFSAPITAGKASDIKTAAPTYRERRNDTCCQQSLAPAAAVPPQWDTCLAAGVNSIVVVTLRRVAEMGRPKKGKLPVPDDRYASILKGTPRDFTHVVTNEINTPADPGRF